MNRGVPIRGAGLPARACETPIGTLGLIGSNAGLREIRWTCDGLHTGGSCGVLDETARQLAEYFAGSRTAFDLPLDLVGTPFQLAAWRALADIPYGSTVTYAEQAARIGRPLAIRAVGAANGANPVPIVLPCHRIVGADGSLTGFGGGLELKRFLLDHEAAQRPLFV
ncbi:MAG TPA: methylated-DNA--[protein]-cysteine S-methyltransferase [Gaiellaceae bacterium]|jgi:methylated-DNA-[protein]-cysteine S-methyltransferase|nr:methylated-DNA--[protein]-cysteine S-methyltransferase [Gaiellaceae bacterium]